MMSANEDVARLVTVIHDVCLTMSESLGPVRIVLDGLSLGIINE
jgi:hypothetical protein